jgi:hypothetical protein
MVSLEPDFKALLDKENVAQIFQDWLITDDVKVTTVRAFAATVAAEEKVNSDLIEASGVALNFGEKVRIRLAWRSARELLSNGSASASSGAPSASPGSKMPDGSEKMLRGKWKELHGINLSGGWLAHEDVMAKVYKGLNNSEQKSLYVPDVATILRRSNLSQKSQQGTLITAQGVQQIDCSINPCTTHPEFYLRMRAYLATIAFCSIMKPAFLTFETVIEVSDFIFEAINMRPDNKRPTLQCLTAIYLCMFGEYAKTLQNEGEDLEIWLKKKSNWCHLWKESISQWDAVPDNSAPVTSVDGQGYGVESDLVQMVNTNGKLIRGMQSGFDRQIKDLRNQFQGGGRGGGGGGRGGGGGGRQRGQQGGKHHQGGNNTWKGEQDDSHDAWKPNDGATKRKVSSGFKAYGARPGAQQQPKKKKGGKGKGGKGK